MDGTGMDGGELARGAPLPIWPTAQLVAAPTAAWPTRLMPPQTLDGPGPAEELCRIADMGGALVVMMPLTS